MAEVHDGGDIAIIGMGCRFPGDAKSPQEFFDMLIKGRSGWSEVPEDRFNVDAFWHPSNERHGTIVCRGGHFLKDDVGAFDAPVSAEIPLSMSRVTNKIFLPCSSVSSTAIGIFVLQS